MKVQSFGVIAQLVEHLLCKQGVVGSTPTISTTSSVRITVSTQDSQSCNRGSIPLPSTKSSHRKMTAFFVVYMLVDILESVEGEDNTS